MRRIEPIEDKILIKPIPEPRRRKSGIWLPDGAKPLQHGWQGLVIAIGPGKEYPDGTVDRPDVQPGDIIYYSEYAGHVIQHEEVEYLVIPQIQILARVIPDVLQTGSMADNAEETAPTGASV